MNYLTEIKQLTHNKYDELSIKENLTQFTVLASISLLIDQNKVIFCAFGTGTKAVGLDKLKDCQFALHSCHAEVMAKRCFQYWIYEQLLNEKCRDLYFIMDKEKYQFKENIKVILYITQPPCGQASIFEESQIYGLSAARPFRNFDKDVENIIENNPKYLRNTPTNSKTPIKSKNPSFCCSDKIMLWNILGIQGSLLNKFIHPIYLNQIIIEYRDKNSLKQSFSVLKRTQKSKKEILMINNKRISKKFRINNPQLIYARNNYFKLSPFHPNNDQFNKRINKEVDAQNYQSISLLYIDQIGQEKINSINGLKWGLAKKDFNKTKFLPKISKFNFYEKYKCLTKLFKKNENQDISYRQSKDGNQKYKLLKQNIKNSFEEWSINKSEYEQFK